MVAGPASVVLGALVLLGWTNGVPGLTSVVSGLPPMSPAVALCFILAGTSLWMLFRDLPSVWPRLLAIVLLVLLALAWIEAVPLLTARARAPVGLLTFLAFTLEVAALLLLTAPAAATRTAGQQAALAAAASGWIGLIGHIFSIEWLAAPGAGSPMAIHGAIGLMLLGAGTAAIDRAGGVLGVLRSRGPGGDVARSLMPIVILAPLVLGWAHMTGLRVGLFDPALGIATLTVGSTVLFAIILVAYAGRLDRSDERRQSAERVLLESAEFNTQIVASAQEGIVVVDEDRRCVLWNPFMERLTGIAAQDVVGRPLLQATSLHVLTQIEAMERALSGQHVEDGFEQKDPSGDSAWLLVTHTPLKNAEGGIRGAIITVHDITEQKRIEHALRESQKRMSMALAAAGVGVWEIDLQSRSVAWTENAAPLLAAAPEAVGGLDDIINRMHPDDRVTVRSAIDRAIGSMGDFDVESRVVLPDGTTRWLHSSGRATSSQPSGEARRLMGVTSDVTGRHVLEAQFLQAQKMEAIGHLAGGVAHDFNNLLTAILGYSALLKEGLTDPARRKDLNEVVKAATRATALTRQLLAFSRQQTPEVTVLNPNDVVQDLLDMLRRLIGETITLTTRLRGDIEAVRSDRGQLEQVIVNLVINARDAMPKGGLIQIETANVRVDGGLDAQGVRMLAGEYVMLGVSDTGIGMSADVRERLFQPFFTTKERGKGTGLGLATVYGIVTTSRGYITVDSEIGRGSSFRVYLPRVADAVAQQTAAVAAVANLQAEPGGHSVLIVEDEEAVRYLTRVMLERAGYRVIEAGTPEQAERMLYELGPVDVLVADVMLPGGRGTDLFARLRIRYPALRVVFMSGYGEDGILDDRQPDPAILFVQKPFVAETLLTSVATLLGAVGAGR
jgi:PAS domain S-box-containing protein